MVFVSDVSHYLFFDTRLHTCMSCIFAALCSGLVLFTVHHASRPVSRHADGGVPVSVRPMRRPAHNPPAVSVFFFLWYFGRRSLSVPPGPLAVMGTAAGFHCGVLICGAACVLSPLLCFPCSRACAPRRLRPPRSGLVRQGPFLSLPPSSVGAALRRPHVR